MSLATASQPPIEVYLARPSIAPKASSPRSRRLYTDRPPWKRPLINCRRRGCLVLAKADGSARAPSLPIALADAVDALLVARQEFEEEVDSTSITEETLNAMLEGIESAAAEASLNRIFLGDNDGCFEGIPLTGRTATRLSVPLPLGTLSFGAYAPVDLVVHVMGAEELAASGHNVVGVFKGNGYGSDRAYVISTAFKIPGTEAMGVSRAIGSYALSDSNRQRLEIRFHAMQIEPLEPSDAVALEAWKEALLPHNPEMDPENGTLYVSLPSTVPLGWQDYLLMGPDHQLLVGNYGSKTLLRRMSGAP